MNINMLIKKSRGLERELIETKSQLQKAQANLEKLIQEKQKMNREISNLLALFANLGQDGLHQNKILTIGFKNEIERLQNIRVLIIEKIHDRESFKREKEYLQKLIEQNNQNQ